MTDLSYSDISKSIDHALLRPDLTSDELFSGCELAKAYDVATVCILPYFVARAAEVLAESNVLTSTTVGFPHGGHATRVKVLEATQALEDGARELDMVVNVSKVKSHDWPYVRGEVREILEVTRAAGGKLKVIFETCYLDDGEKIELCALCGELGADFVKTSTGFGSAGATDHDLKLMRAHSPPPVAVKASGGVRTLSRVLEVRALGVTRIGTSTTSAILDEWRERLGLPPVSGPRAAAKPGSGY